MVMFYGYVSLLESMRFTCARECIQVCNVYTHFYLYTRVYITYVCMYIYTCCYVYIYIMHVHTYLYMYVWIYHHYWYGPSQIYSSLCRVHIDSVIVSQLETNG